MPEEQLPIGTVRDLRVMLGAVLEIVRDTAREIAEHLRPFVEPPEDMRVVGDAGVIYSGIVVIDAGRVVAGIVIEVGRVTTAPAREPIITPSPRPAYERPRSPFSGITDHYERDGRLPGWADDPREEDEPWRRR